MFSAAAAVKRNIPLPPDLGEPFVFTASADNGKTSFDTGIREWENLLPNYYADWGDGSPVEHVYESYKRHEFPDDAVYTVTLTGRIPWKVQNATMQGAVLSVLNLGECGWLYLTDCFAWATPTFISFVAGVTDVSKVTIINGMFDHQVIQSADFTGFNFDHTVGVYCLELFDSCSYLASEIYTLNWKVLDVRYMFYDCIALPPVTHVSTWDVTELMAGDGFMSKATTAMTTALYDQTLTNWGAQTVLPGVVIDFGPGATYTAAGQAGRDSLIAQGWTIYDAGLAP